MQWQDMQYQKDPAIVVDFGTATTYDLIGPDGTLESCIIAPGIETAGTLLMGAERRCCLRYRSRCRKLRLRGIL